LVRPGALSKINVALVEAFLAAIFYAKKSKTKIKNKKSKNQIKNQKIKKPK